MGTVRSAHCVVAGSTRMAVGAVATVVPRPAPPWTLWPWPRHLAGHRLPVPGRCDHRARRWGSRHAPGPGTAGASLPGYLHGYCGRGRVGQTPRAEQTRVW